MDGRHTVVNLDVLREEQRNIDTIIDSLLNYSTNNECGELKEKKRVGSATTSGSSANTPQQIKKGRGRPPKAITLPSSPVPSISSPNPDVSVTKPSFEVVVECLKRLSDQNKNLLNFVEVLSEDVKNNITSGNRNSAGNSTSADIQVLPQSSVSVVEERLEKLEQNINSNILICQGAGVESLIEESSRGSTKPNLERLKGEVCKAVCGENVTSVDIGNMQVTVFGKDKKKVKIDCHNPSSKLFLVKQARRKRPEGVYVSEYLTPSKVKIFYNLRQLKKQHPDKIQAVFSRGGNLFHRLCNSDREVRVNSLDDLTGIVVGTVAREETPSAAADGN